LNQERASTMSSLSITNYFPFAGVKGVSQTVRRGEVPGQKVGRHWPFHREIVDAWLKKEKPTG
jgi:excisionase family DNA binding protein